MSREGVVGGYWWGDSRDLVSRRNEGVGEAEGRIELSVGKGERVRREERGGG
jgi:hypothetical protein